MRLQRHVVRPSTRHALLLPTLALVAFAVIALGVQIMRCRHGTSLAEIAEHAVEAYTTDAFPAWRADHPGRACPDSLDELSPYMNTKDTRDPWGNFYRFACAHGSLWVVSSGADGRIGTDDDVHSGR